MVRDKRGIPDAAETGRFIIGGFPAELTTVLSKFIALNCSGVGLLLTNAKSFTWVFLSSFYEFDTDIVCSQNEALRRRVGDTLSRSYRQK